MFQVSTPQSSEDWQAYYQLRWQVLRAPWGEPRGSEQDDLEQDAEHRFIKNKEGDVLGVARLHFNNHEQAQVRYMAVAEGNRNQHIGSRLLHDLEKIAWTQNADELVLFARERALEFYKRHGYELKEKAHLAYGDVQHYKMVKQKPSEPGWFRHPNWTQVLQNIWRESIPISDAMGIKVESYTDWQFTTSADLDANLNLHNTMFAGSIYSLALLIPGLSAGARRLHDTGRSGWWQLLWLVPIIGWLVLIVFLAQDSHEGENDYGPNPKELAAEPAAV